MNFYFLVNSFLSADTTEFGDTEPFIVYFVCLFLLFIMLLQFQLCSFGQKNYYQVSSGI